MNILSFSRAAIPELAPLSTEERLSALERKVQRLQDMQQWMLDDIRREIAQEVFEELHLYDLFDNSYDA